MKNTILLAILVVGLFAKAQQQELIENTWYLEKLVIDDVEYFIPQNEENSIVTATFSGGIVITSVCNGLSGDIEFNDENNTFYTPSDSWGVTLIECVLSENEDFENRYFYEFWSINFMEIPQPFHYEITSSENSLRLIVTNSLGGKAYYNNVKLSTQEISGSNQDKFKIAFQNEDLIIKSSKSVAKSVSIYDLTGRLVLASDFSNIERINASRLPKGIYIIKISDRQGEVFSKKVMKE